MTFTAIPLEGAYLVDLEPHGDARGFFARTFCVREFQTRNLMTVIAQSNLSLTRTRGTIRGLHFQAAPGREAKLVRCVRGAIHDVIVDLRPDSPTYSHHFATTLSAKNRRALFIPKSFAHGFQTLVDETEVEYQMSECYEPGLARGYRFDDPALAIQWPLPATVVSAQDCRWPPFPTSPLA